MSTEHQSQPSEISNADDYEQPTENQKPTDTTPLLEDNHDSQQSDPFADLDRLRLSQDYASLTDVKPVLTTIAVRKPHKQEFIRVRPGEEWRFETGTFTDKEVRETYLIEPRLWSALPGEVQPTVLLVTISRNSPVPFLWPCVLPGPDGRPNRWHESALEASRLAESEWLKVMSDLPAGCYVPHVASGNLPEPEWPDITLSELLRLAFRDRFIRDIDHPVLKRMRGEI